MHVVGFGLLVFVIAPRHLAVGTQVFGVGLGITAYVFGLRHAFDADHIAAIDNTTRKLMADGGRPRSVGFWFAMGHSGWCSCSPHSWPSGRAWPRRWRVTARRSTPC